jgi:hypothetical protein
MRKSRFVNASGAWIDKMSRGCAETPLFAMPFYAKNDDFTKTGSGQT